MIRQKKLVLLCITILVLEGKCADKYTDENRPYEFGFSIDGEQHRHEKKDENGIIMGEFGFITADGVYHVTVYATDENGGFKILSMKNIRVKPYPTAKSGPEKGRSLELPSPPQTSQKSTLTTSEQKKTSLPEPQKPGPASPAKSCSHCSIPTTTTTTTTTVQPPIAPNNGEPRIPSISQEPNIPPKYDQNHQNAPQQNANSDINPQQQQRQFDNQKSSYYPQQNANSHINPQQQQRKFDNQQNSYYPQQNANSHINLQQQQRPFDNQQNSNYPQQNANTPINNNGQQEQSGKPQYNPHRTQDNPQPNQNNANQQQSFPQQELNNKPRHGIGSGATQPFSYPQNEAQSNSQRESNPKQLHPQSETNTQSQSQNSQFGPNRSPKSYEQQSQQQQLPQGQFNGKDTELNPTGTYQGTKPFNKPQLISAQMQIVDKNTDIHHKRPGEKEGLPEGLSKDDMTNLLYTFNYTVGFHGHFEEGYTNGAKQGYYFVTGRNGVRTRIDYVADEHGFRPKITQEVLDILSGDVPKPETEKDPKYGLKGYEFKWIYYPIDSRRR